MREWCLCVSEREQCSQQGGVRMEIGIQVWKLVKEVHADNREGLTRKHWVKSQPLHCILKRTPGCFCILKQIQMKGNWRVEQLR